MIIINCLNCECLIKKPSKIKKFCSSTCREKHWVKNNRERLNECVRRYRARRYEKEGSWRETGKKVIELRKWMVELKSKPCTDCGGFFPLCCMDFDHNKGVKSYNVGSMFAHHYSKELIQTELDKCELVCSNCHRIRTRDRKTGSGKAYLKYKNGEK
jgi:hypothetical protein